MSFTKRLAAAAGAAAAAFIGRKAARKLLPLVEVAVTPVALGAALSAGAMALFFNIADEIRGQEGVWRLDHAGLNLAESLRTPGRTALMRTVSDLARPDIMSTLGAASMIIAWRSKRWRNEAVLMAVVLSGGGAIIGTIKYRVGRQRPSLVEALAVESGLAGEWRPATDPFFLPSATFGA